MTIKHHPRRRLHTWANLFCHVHSLAELCALLGLKVAEFKGLASAPVYQAFWMPKKRGGERLIEDPAPDLKDILQMLNFYLQCIYFFHRTDAVYGFMIGAKDDKRPRNIVTNATRHVGKQWMVNIDFSDFFHCVSYDDVVNIFAEQPFSFEEELCHWLAKLTTYQQRLPMGAPTSPVLSNFACMVLDYGLLALAREQNWTYTRYADDLTFSADQAIETQHIEQIRLLCQTNGFIFNESKLRLYTPNESKYVTGLKVTEQGVTLADDYIATVSTEINKLRNVLEIKYRTGQRGVDWIWRYQRQIKGSIDFVSFVLGENSQEVNQLQHQLTEAQNPTNRYDPISWLDFGYHYNYR